MSGLQISDAGQLAIASHGANRGDSFIAVPERLASHAFNTFHHNPTGLIQRDAVRSCSLLPFYPTHTLQDHSEDLTLPSPLS